MMRIVLIAAIIAIVWRLLTGRALMPGRHTPPSADTPNDQAHAMVRCKHCGTHVPAKQAVLEGDDWYCCQEHRDDARH